MQRVLVLYEKSRTGRTPESAVRFARGAEIGGLDVRLRSLDCADIEDVTWAQALALALAPTRGREMPWAVKRWMDALGFVGWGRFEGKSGCIFASGRRVSDDDARAYELVARLLVCRGMALCSVARHGESSDGSDASASDPVEDNPARHALDRGYRFARRMVQYRLRHDRPDAPASAVRLRAAALALVESDEVEPDDVGAPAEELLPARAAG